MRVTAHPCGRVVTEAQRPTATLCGRGAHASRGHATTPSVIGRRKARVVRLTHRHVAFRRNGQSPSQATPSTRRSARRRPRAPDPIPCLSSSRTSTRPAPHPRRTPPAPSRRGRQIRARRVDLLGARRGHRGASDSLRALPRPARRPFASRRASMTVSRLDDLPPDQNAALSLLCVEARAMRRSPRCSASTRRAVHDRAHAALAVLAPRQARELTPERRAEIGDFMLGQQARARQSGITTRSFWTAHRRLVPGRRRSRPKLAPLAGRLPAADREHEHQQAEMPGRAPAGDPGRTSRLACRQTRASTAELAGRPALLLAAIVAALSSRSS